jgi:hypothetical protein
MILYRSMAIAELQARCGDGDGELCVLWGYRNLVVGASCNNVLVYTSQLVQLLILYNLNVFSLHMNEKTSLQQCENTKKYCVLVFD